MTHKQRRLKLRRLKEMLLKPSYFEIKYNNDNNNSNKKNNIIIVTVMDLFTQ